MVSLTAGCLSPQQGQALLSSGAPKPEPGSGKEALPGRGWGTGHQQLLRLPKDKLTFPAGGKLQLQHCSASSHGSGKFGQPSKSRNGREKPTPLQCQLCGELWRAGLAWHQSWLGFLRCWGSVCATSTVLPLKPLVSIHQCCHQSIVLIFYLSIKNSWRLV